MKFLEMRNTLMVAMSWDRRVATLAARLVLGVDTWEGIADCPSFLGRPLLSPKETMEIRKVLTK